MQFCEVLTVKPTGCIVIKLQSTNAIIKVFLNHRIPRALYQASMLNPISWSIKLGVFHKGSMSWIQCIMKDEIVCCDVGPTPTGPEDERTVYQRTPRKYVF